MAYFLKKTNNKKGTYLQIYSSFYDPERGHTAHKAYKPIGYVHELQVKGIDDPITFYKEEVNKLNQEANAAKAVKKAKQISDDSPEKLIGYFPMKNINDKLSVKKYIDLMQTAIIEEISNPPFKIKLSLYLDLDSLSNTRSSKNICSTSCDCRLRFPAKLRICPFNCSGVLSFILTPPYMS